MISVKYAQFKERIEFLIDYTTNKLDKKSNVIFAYKKKQTLLSAIKHETVYLLC